MSSWPAVEVYQTPTGTRYVRLSEIPEPSRSKFQQYLLGAAMPVVDGEGEIAYVVDWLDWLYERRADRR